MKKVIVLMVAALMGQMVVASDVDLYKGLLFWIKDQNNIEGNELRKTTYPLSQVFDGSFYNQLAGTAIPKRDNQDYTFSLSFKVGELNCVNRLLVIGSHSIYLDTNNKLYYNGLNTTFTVDAANKYYSLVFRVDESHRLTIYAGVKDQRLSQVMSSIISGYLNFSSAVGMSSFKLGYGSKPSTGNLQSGQFANVRFWTRALTDEECEMADKSQNVFLETKPLGCPPGVKYDFFPLSGNMFGVDESSTTPKCSSYSVKASGWAASAGRLDASSLSMSSSGNATIIFSDFGKLFEGSYVVNNGRTLSESYYGSSAGRVSWGTGYGISDGKIYYPYPCRATETSDLNATYSMWFKIDERPSSSVNILSREVTPATVVICGDHREIIENQNAALNISINTSMQIEVSGSQITKKTFSRILNLGEWYHIAVVGKSQLSITVYVNGSEIGNISTPYTTLGYLPPIDGRTLHTGGSKTWDGFGSGMHGGISNLTSKLSIGGWNGTIDEVVFYAKDLSAPEVKALYEEGAPPDPNTTITPTTRNFSTGGGGGAIITAGNAATWWARVTEPWITLSANSGNIGYPVAYTVSATTNAEQRIGYVYVNGHAHEVTQDGLGGTISSDGATYEKAGGSGTIAVGVQNGIAWKATSNVDWLSVSPTNGIGSGSVSCQVSAYNEVATRQGTLTIAGNTFTVFQYGKRIKLEPTSTTQNYETHVIPITVNALAITTWSVTPKNSWISVVDAGNGQGGDLVTIAISENPSYKARTGTVTIGTETFTVTQQGRPTAALSFSISPTASTASVEGANGTIAVTATPDLPWTATSGANWLTVYAATATGSGNGNVVYSASPNPTLSQRTGNITVTPEAASGMTAKTHKVTQPAAQSALSSNGYEFEAAGESCSVDVSVANIVQWSISESLDWITVNGSTSRTGPGTVTLQAAANNTVYPRSGTVKIAGKNFSVSQKARGVELEYDTMLFGTDGGYESISIHPDGNSSWTAVASDPTWITIFQGDSGTGDGEILYIVAPYVGDGGARTGWITVGSQKVYITQRAYDLHIEPNGTNVVGNAGAGEFGVSAYINDVWNAIVTEPWITIVSGYDAGTGSGVVRFLYTENNTGKTRTGKIIVAGEVYTLEQRARQMVAITATAEHGGHVSGGGSYDLGTQVTLTAVPDSGYAFSYWTGAVSSMQNPLTVTADIAKSFTAVFEPLPIAFTSVVSGTDGVTLTWNNLAWAATYRIYRGVTSVPGSATVLVELPNNGNCTYLDETGDVDVEYWYWIEAEGPSDEMTSDPMTGKKEKPIVYSSITYTNLHGAANPNPATYREGTLVSFANPGAVTGYTFAGWTPSQITADMTGAQTVNAAWTANGYSIAYNPNGGSGTMAATTMTYDTEGLIASNGFTWAGHVFTGWATNETGDVVYAAGQLVTNLTAQSSGVVTLYAVWEPLVVAVPVVTPPDGSSFTESSCTVTLSCATDGAVIYYSPRGATPRLTDAYRYTGPFAITDTATIKAVAVLDGVRSEYMTATITKRGLSLAEAAGAAELTFTTGGDADWTPVADATAASGFSVRSGTIGCAAAGNISTTWLQTEVSGAGTFAFRWKVDCEWDDSGDATWDHVVVTTNGEEAVRMDGTSDWEDVSLVFDDAGTHTIRWTFVKDDYDEEGAGYADCAWVNGVTWTPSGTVVPPDPIPELPGTATAGQVAAALEGSADTNLVAHIADVATYNAYRAWADRRGLGHQAVKDSPRAWLSFALDSDKLITKPLERGDIEIKAFSPRLDGLFSFEVEVKDIALGPNALIANLARVFGVEGSILLDDSTFSSDNVEVAFEAPENGKLRFVARPLVADGSFFMRVNMRDVYGDVVDSDVEPVVTNVTVTFDANGGVGGRTTTRECGTTLTAPTVTREGYTFTGWSPAVAATVPASNVTYIAQWKINQYTVVFNANGGNGDTTNTQDYGTSLSAPTVTREGYTFTGWSSAVAATVPASNVTYTAQWRINQYMVTFNANGGIGGGAEMQNFGTAITAPTVTREGFTFTGWSPGVAATVPASNVTYIAQWEESLPPASEEKALYCIIDLSAGYDAASYPVTYTNEPPSGGFNVDEYKTTKLVLRRIEPGPFMMCGEYEVTLTKPFYCGIFEVTQKQYELVTGNNPSEYKGDMRPVEMVTYDAIRGSSEGARWPESSAVDSNSFMGKLRARTGLEFDLPTEAQWEYACRAGTTSSYNNGGNSIDDLDLLGRHAGNQGDGHGGYTQHTKVGSYVPNAWGLYDMHGNVLEHCLDWCGALSNGTDPQGPSSGLERVRRGGAFSWYDMWCTSSYRERGLFGTSIAPSDAGNGDGFRLARTLSEVSVSEVSVTFDANGGNGGTTTMQECGTTLTAPTVTREGYTFTGWSPAVAATVPASNVTYTAQWEVCHVDSDPHKKVQLWEGGPYWATTNIGADEPWDYGYYFWWGDTVGYKRENDAWVASDGSSLDFSFGEGNTPTYDKDIATLKSGGWITEDSVLVPEHDAAHVHWGGNWRMPTGMELDGLAINCDWTWTTTNGVNGYVVRGRGNYNSASIFLPAAGYCYGTSLYDSGSDGNYWSSVPGSDDYDAYGLYFYSGDHDTNGYGGRYYGQSVRPVQGFTE